MDKTTTTNFELQALTNSLGIPTWIGMRDEFNSYILSQHNLFIINVQPQAMTGLHWTALLKSEKQMENQMYFLFVLLVVIR